MDLLNCHGGKHPFKEGKKTEGVDKCLGCMEIEDKQLKAVLSLLFSPSSVVGESGSSGAAAILEASGRRQLQKEPAQYALNLMVTCSE